MILFSPLWFWGALQVYLKRQFKERMAEVFQGAGLTSPMGKLPGFVFDYPIDEFTRKMRLTRRTLSKSDFQGAKGNLESGLNIYIDEFRENREGGTIDIIYSQSPMPECVTIENISEIKKCHFAIGRTRSAQIVVDIRKVPHLLIAGQTGGGKSTFLRQFITTLYLNNSEMEFTLIDLKGGLEFQIFGKLKRATVAPTIQKAIGILEDLGEKLDHRMAQLKENDCKDLESYLTLPEASRKKSAYLKKIIEDNLRRHVVVVDEAAEMFLTGSHSNAKETQKAREILSRIARQGRAVGVHLTIATQRPDVRSLDPQVKANLVGVLCMQMANVASSMTVLGNGRATELPSWPGRAIWKCGAEMIEVQTPFLDDKDAAQLLESEMGEANPHAAESPVTTPALV
jgi:S-DNA-T family DNA segregation ATPase FtsK/SpoIIIE